MQSVVGKNGSLRSFFLGSTLYRNQTGVFAVDRVLDVRPLKKVRVAELFPTPTTTEGKDEGRNEGRF